MRLSGMIVGMLLLFQGVTLYGQDKCSNRFFSNHLHLIYDEDITPFFLEEHLADMDTLISSKPITHKQCFHNSVQLKYEYDKYPSILRKELSIKVIWFEKMVYKGVPFYASYHPDSSFVYLKNLTHNLPYLKATFHHEVSSVLIRRYGSDTLKQKYEDLNRSSFKYKDNATQGVASIHSSEEYGADYLKKGFVNQYATSYWENDFNEIASALFMGRADIWEFYRTSSILRKKLDFVIHFYQSIDATFTHDYFRNLIKD